jgi:hypothetical protein
MILTVSQLYNNLFALVGQIKDLIHFGTFLGLFLTHLSSENLYDHDVAWGLVTSRAAI